MVNDLTTLNGSLQEIIDRLEDNLSDKGVNASFSASDGILGLVDEIGNIQTGGGGASNVVTGTFTTGSTRGSTETVTISHTGNGYPITCMVYVNGGIYGNTNWYNTIAQYDVGAFGMMKGDMGATPTYNLNNNDNKTLTYYAYKSSTTTATSIGFGSSANVQSYDNDTTATYGYQCVKFNNDTTLRYSIGNNTSNTRGLTPSTTYAYIVIYSE